MDGKSSILPDIRGGETKRAAVLWPPFLHSKAPSLKLLGLRMVEVPETAKHNPATPVFTRLLGDSYFYLLILAFIYVIQDHTKTHPEFTLVGHRLGTSESWLKNKSGIRHRSA
jgi:hypothetical protein